MVNLTVEYRTAAHDRICNFRANVVFRGRFILGLCFDIRIFVHKSIAYVLIQEIHICREICAYAGADGVPVAVKFVAVNFQCFGKADNDILYQIVSAFRYDLIQQID